MDERVDRSYFFGDVGDGVVGGVESFESEFRDVVRDGRPAFVGAVYFGDGRVAFG